MGNLRGGPWPVWIMTDRDIPREQTYPSIERHDLLSSSGDYRRTPKVDRLLRKLGLSDRKRSEPSSFNEDGELPPSKSSAYISEVSPLSSANKRSDSRSSTRRSQRSDSNRSESHARHRRKKHATPKSKRSHRGSSDKQRLAYSSGVPETAHKLSSPLPWMSGDKGHSSAASSHGPSRSEFKPFSGGAEGESRKGPWEKLEEAPKQLWCGT